MRCQYLTALLARFTSGNASGRRGTPVIGSTGIFKALLAREWWLRFSCMCHGNPSPGARLSTGLLVRQVRQRWNNCCCLHQGRSFSQHTSAFLWGAILNRVISWDRVQEFNMCPVSMSWTCYYECEWVSLRASQSPCTQVHLCLNRTTTTSREKTGRLACQRCWCSCKTGCTSRKSAQHLEQVLKAPLNLWNCDAAVSCGQLPSGALLPREKCQTPPPSQQLGSTCTTDSSSMKHINMSLARKANGHYNYLWKPSKSTAPLQG